MMESEESAFRSKEYRFVVNKFMKMERVKGKPIPIARSGHRAVANDDFMWVLGGYNSKDHDVGSNEAYPLFRDLWKYNISTNEWALMKMHEKMPSELASHSAIRHNEYMIVFGGTGVPFGEQSSDKLSVCHLQTGHWSAIKCTGSRPDKIYGQAMAIIGDHLYVYGGTTGYIYNTDLHRLDLTTNIWHRILPDNNRDELPNERYRHEIVIDEEHLYVLGGGTSQDVYSLREIYVFSVRENKWTLKIAKRDPSVKGYPKARRCHSCVQLGAAAYICGGYNGHTILGDLWKLDLKKLQWQKMGDMPEPVYFHSASVTSEGCMTIFGGVSSIESSTRTDSCYRVWLEIPSLQTLSWFALIELRPTLLKMSRHELINLGIHRHLINKLTHADGA